MTSSSHTYACTHAYTHSLSLALTLTHTYSTLNTHTIQEEKIKELHESILPPFLGQLNQMVESNNSVNGWIWGDKVYNYNDGRTVDVSESGA